MKKPKEEDGDETKTEIFSLARGEIRGAKKRGLGRGNIREGLPEPGKVIWQS